MNMPIIRHTLLIAERIPVCHFSEEKRFDLRTRGGGLTHDGINVPTIKALHISLDCIRRCLAM